MSPRFISGISLLAALAFAAGADEIYRWVDAQGRVQFGDKPPAEGAELLELTPTRQGDPQLQQRRERGDRLADIMAEDRQIRGQETHAAKQANAERRAKCAAAQERVSKLDGASFIYEPTADPSNPRILDDQERQRYEQQLQAEIHRHCGNADIQK